VGFLAFAQRRNPIVLTKKDSVGRRYFSCSRIALLIDLPSRRREKSERWRTEIGKIYRPSLSALTNVSCFELAPFPLVMWFRRIIEVEIMVPVVSPSEPKDALTWLKRSSSF
jgi:hypothetical protein